jgi:hypothetical protein
LLAGLGGSGQVAEYILARYIERTVMRKNVSIAILLLSSTIDKITL